MYNNDLFKLVDSLYKNKEKKIFKKLFDLKITEQKKKAIFHSIENRNLINEIREVNNITEFQRDKFKVVDFLGMTGELVFSTTILKAYKQLSYKERELINIDLPAVSEYLLDTSKKDCKFKLEDKVLHFDIKTAFKKNKYNCLRINKNHHDKIMKSNDIHFYLVGLVDSTEEEMENATNIEYCFLNKNYFNEHAKLLEHSPSGSKKFTPFYYISLNYLSN